MVGRVRGSYPVALLLGAWLIGASSALGQSWLPHVLVRYSFEDSTIATGPDTLSIFQHARGFVRLSSTFHVSGYTSVEVQEASGDGDFAELQGYFPNLSTGTAYTHFMLLVTNPQEELNIALAGPAGFRLAKDGIAFWLKTKDGWLTHVSDSIPKRLLELKRFCWYAINLAYHVDTGRYDLDITEEGSSLPAVVLKHQANATLQPSSVINTFSFIGDLDDKSTVDYFVDDVVLGTDREIALLPFSAPGRRRLFVDRLLEARVAKSANHGPLERTFLELIWQSKFEEALRFAGDRLAADEHPIEQSQWLERSGDAAFLLDRFEQAREFYEKSYSSEPRQDALLKLADVYYKLGRLEEERAIRERYYGSFGRETSS